MVEKIKNVSEMLLMGFNPKPIITESYDPKCIDSVINSQVIANKFISRHQTGKIIEYRNPHHVWTTVDGDLPQLFNSHIQTAVCIAHMSDASRRIEAITYQEYAGLPFAKYLSLTDLSIVIVTNLGDGLLMVDPFTDQTTFTQHKGRYPHASHLMIRQLK